MAKINHGQADNGNLQRYGKIETGEARVSRIGK
jgi:hypothetical protein